MTLLDPVQPASSRRGAPDSSRAFLPAEEVPADVLRLRPGEVLFPVRLRRVVRVGYRVRADDLCGEAEALLRAPDGVDLLACVHRLCGGSSAGVPAPGREASRDAAWLLARALCRARGFGGPQRGVVVEDLLGPGDARRLGSSAVRFDGEVLRVQSTRCVRLGTRYPGSGSGEDREDGGLADARTAVLVRPFTLRGGACPWEMLSGDLRRGAADEAAEAEQGS